MVSSVAQWEPKIVELAEAGLTAPPVYDRLKLEGPVAAGRWPLAAGRRPVGQGGSCTCTSFD